MQRFACSFTLSMALACGAGPADAAPTPGCKVNVKKCHVIIAADPNVPCANLMATPSTTAVPLGERKKPYRLVWVLPQGYTFIPSKGDGIAIKEPYDEQDEFDNGVVSDNDDGDLSGKASGQRWRWRFANSKDGLYEYTVRFRHRTTGTVCTLDPVISNLDAG